MVWRKLRRNKTVPREITSIFGKKKVVLRETPRPVTPFGGLSVFVKFLEKIGYAEAVAKSVSHPIALSQRHRSGGDLHGLFDLGGERGTALCAHRTAAGRSRVAPPAGDRAFPNR